MFAEQCQLNNSSEHTFQLITNIKIPFKQFHFDTPPLEILSTHISIFRLNSETLEL